jgi:hypothetical protein
MDKVKQEIQKELASIYEAGEYHARAKSNAKYKQKDITGATYFITALIIKWLESKKAVIIEYYYGNSENTSNIGRNQLITELIGEVR